jgi:hypothetical protein
MASFRINGRGIAARVRFAFLAARARTSRRTDRNMKIGKTEAHYGRSTKAEHCGHSFEGDKNYCRHFIEPSHPATPPGDPEKHVTAAART